MPTREDKYFDGNTYLKPSSTTASTICVYSVVEAIKVMELYKVSKEEQLSFLKRLEREIATLKGEPGWEDWRSQGAVNATLHELVSGLRRFVEEKPYLSVGA